MSVECAKFIVQKAKITFVRRVGEVTTMTIGTVGTAIATLGQVETLNWCVVLVWRTYTQSIFRSLVMRSVCM
jgi:hypothetical protein